MGAYSDWEREYQKEERVKEERKEVNEKFPNTFSCCAGYGIHSKTCYTNNPIHISPLVQREMNRLRKVMEAKGLIPHTPTVFELSDIAEPCNPCNPCGHCSYCCQEEQGHKP